MAWSAPVTHAVGDVLTASDWNINSNDLVVLETQFALFGKGATIVGAAPAVTAPNWLFQAGNVAPTYEGVAGEFSITFPTSFPTGVLWAIACEETGAASSAPVTVGMRTATTSSVLHMWLTLPSTGAALTSYAHNLCWAAVGF